MLLTCVCHCLQRPGASARRMEDITAAGENVVAALQAALQRAQLTQAQLEGNAARTADNLNDALAAIDKLQVRGRGRTKACSRGGCAGTCLVCYASTEFCNMQLHQHQACRPLLIAGGHESHRRQVRLCVQGHPGLLVCGCVPCTASPSMPPLGPSNCRMTSKPQAPSTPMCKATAATCLDFVYGMCIARCQP